MMKKAFITLIIIGILLIGAALFIEFKSKSIQDDLVQKYEEKMYSNSSVKYSIPETELEEMFTPTLKLILERPKSNVSCKFIEPYSILINI